MYGWRGKWARIDLSRKSAAIEEAKPGRLHRFLGGRGLAGALLRPHILRSVDDPQSPLFLLTGPLVDTAAPTSGRMTVAAKSPLTGLAGDASVGGAFGTMLKRAGLDGLIITGRADGLSGIEIDGEDLSIVSAAGLAGMTVSDTTARLKGKGAKAVIGPAGENKVRFAAVLFDRHYAAGRNGLGCVFAEKNLKYITVKGKLETPVADPAGVSAAAEDVSRLIHASPVLTGPFGITRFGTPALYDLMDARRMMPTDNFRKTRFEHASQMNATALKAGFHPKQTGCRGCPIRCKKTGVDRQNNRVSLPEFETLSHFSALLENRDLSVVVEANRLCNELGMDTISTAATLACHAEVRGYPLSPGEIITLIASVARREGAGDLLAEGSARYARAAGRADAAVTVKGQELPAYDPRGADGMALAYAVSTRGGCHLRAYPISHEILRKPVPTDRFSFAGKARMIKIGEDVNAAADSVTACKFVFFAATLEEYARILTAVTGEPFSTRELLRVGERICVNERLMNCEAGGGADDLPLRFFQTPGSGDERSPIPPLSRSEFQSALARYHAVRGLDETGRPLPETLIKLGLE